MQKEKEIAIPKKFEIDDLNGTVMQIEKVLINDRFRVSKVP